MKGIGKQFKEIADELNTEVLKATQKATKSGIEHSLKLVKERSPRDADRKKSRVGKPRYASGWRIKEEPLRGFVFHNIVHNVNDPTLTHLLEDGHVLFLYGRPTGKRTKSFPHIRNSELDGFEKMEKELERELKNIWKIPWKYLKTLN